MYYRKLLNLVCLLLAVSVQAASLDWYTSNTVCGGEYREPGLLNSVEDQKPLIAGQIRVALVGAITLSSTGTSILHNVTIEEPGRRIDADTAYLYRDAKTQKLSVIKAYGHVKIRETGKLFLADHAVVQLKDKVVDVVDAEYRIAMTPPWASAQAQTLTGLVARGSARRGQQLNPNTIQLAKASYTTCAPNNNAWRITAERLYFDREAGTGKAYKSWLYLQNTPILYAPYLPFPIDKRRKSGWLYPRFWTSSANGVIIGLPYYFNLAPQLDDTFTPNIYSKRGVMLENELRGLTENSRSHLLTAIMPNDVAFKQFKANAAADYTLAPPRDLARLQNASNTRGMISFENSTQLMPSLSANVKYNYMSDDYYEMDFTPTMLNRQSVSSQLLQQLTVNYQGEHWQVEQTVQQFQTLHPITQKLVFDQYRMLPAITAHGNYTEILPGVALDISGQFVHFDHASETYVDPFSNLPYSTGERYHLAPQVSLPFYRLGGYVVPSVQWDLARYQLRAAQTLPVEGQNPIQRAATGLQRELPILNIDSGLTLQRDVNLWGDHYQQTLEPRAYYLYVPYRDQSAIPLFDTTIPAFTFQQMFNTNRFSGFDRIGDANQFAYGLTTRWLNQQSGSEKLRLSIGQIKYFHERQVSLCSTPGCIAAENPNYQHEFSPIAAEAYYSLLTNTSVGLNVAWNPYFHSWDNRSVSVLYKDALARVLYFNFADTKTVGLVSLQPTVALPTRIVTLGGNLPLTEPWSVLGVLNAHFIPQHDNTKSVYFGVQYDSCCVATRVVAGRSFVGYAPDATRRYDNRVFLQVLFKGLGALGTLDQQVINAIPGYTDAFARNGMPL